MSIRVPTAGDRHSALRSWHRKNIGNSSLLKAGTERIPHALLGGSWVVISG